MTLHLDARDVGGLQYLDMVTRVLQRRRLAQPGRETWEAAEVQWWWSRDRHEDPSRARVWCDEDGPAAAVTFTWWAGGLSCTVLADGDFTPAWRFIAQRSAQFRNARIDMEIIEREVEMQEAARAAGYVPSQDIYVASWLDPAEIQSPRRLLPDGYEIVSRAATGDRPHPMAPRNGPEVEQRLGECSLYDPDLDLAAHGPDGTVAGYALFWADPVTRVGVVEPMRVEAAHSGRGVGTHLLGEGLRRLADGGCSRLKVMSESSNAIARALYGGAGFRVTDVSRVWRYAPAADDAG